MFQTIRKYIESGIFGLENLYVVICTCLYVTIATFVLTSFYFMVLKL